MVEEFANFQGYDFSEASMQARSHVQPFKAYLPEVEDLPAALKASEMRRKWLKKRCCVIIALALRILNDSVKKTVSVDYIVTSVNYKSNEAVVNFFRFYLNSFFFTSRISTIFV